MCSNSLVNWFQICSYSVAIRGQNRFELVGNMVKNKWQNGIKFRELSLSLIHGRNSLRLGAKSVSNSWTKKPTYVDQFCT